MSARAALRARLRRLCRRLRSYGAHVLQFLKGGTFIGICVLLVLLIVLARCLASLTHDATSFSIDASSDIAIVDFRCGDRVTWDLPPGEFLLDPSTRDLPMSELASVTLRGGAHARVWLDQRRQLNAEFSSTGSYHCPGTDLDRATLALDDGEHLLGTSTWAYRSRDPVGAETNLMLLLGGRLRIGEEPVQGAGLANAASQPILRGALIEARTPDPQTLQKRLIHSEPIESGSQIDSHGCMDKKQAELVDCIEDAGATTTGFLRNRVGPEGMELQVQAFVVGRAIGVRQFGGIERRIVVTLWSRWVTSSFPQIFAAIVFGLSAVAQFTSFFAGTSSRHDDDDDDDEERSD